MTERILTSDSSVFSNSVRYHGTVGNATEMFDIYGESLYIGDLVCLFHHDKYDRECHKLAYACEENGNITRWTGLNRKFIMGIADTWNEELFEDLNYIDNDFLDKLMEKTDGWAVIKVKDHKDTVDGEMWALIYPTVVEKTWD